MQTFIRRICFHTSAQIIEIFTGRPAELLVLVGAGGAESRGSIVTIDPSDDSVKRICSFSVPGGIITDAKQPWNGKYVEIDGYLYGIARQGAGNTTNGCIYKFNLSTQEVTVVYQFDSASSGPFRPEAELFLLPNGNLMGTTSVGGNNGSGVLFEFNVTTNVLTVRYHFNTSGGSLIGPVIGGFVRSTIDGMVYAICIGGNGNFGGIVQIDTTNWVLDLKHSFTGATSSSRTSILSYAILVEAPNGKLYGVSNLGGTNSTGSIYEFNVSTFTYTLKSSFSTTASGTFNVGANPISGLFLAANGKFYGMSQVGSTNGAGAVYEYDYINNILTAKVAAASTSSGRASNYFIEYSNKLYAPVLGLINASGGIIEYDYNTNVLTVKQSFTTSTGTGPKSSFMLASNGKLYASNSSNGGTNVSGNIFSYEPGTNTFTVLHSFFNTPETTEPSLPRGKLTLASDGYLYGVSIQGGTNSVGTIYKYDRLKNEQHKEYDFTLGTSGANPNCELIELDQQLWGISTLSSVSPHGKIWTYDIRTETFTSKYNFTSSGHTPGYGMMLGSDGFFYGTTSSGGTGNHGTLYKFDPVNLIWTSLVDMGSFGAPYVNGDGPQGAPVELDGYLYYTGGSSGSTQSYLLRYNMVTQSIEVLGTTSIAGIGSSSTPFVGSDGKIYGCSGESETSGGFFFSYDPGTGTITRLFTGGIPTGVLAEYDNKIYGTTNTGGIGFGSVFSWHMYTNTFKNVLSFDGSTIYGDQNTGNSAGVTLLPPTIGLLNQTQRNYIEAEADENQTVYTVGDDKIIKFTTSGELNVTYVPEGVTAWILVVGGGGSGGGRPLTNNNAQTAGSGGGGGGGVIEYLAFSLTVGTYQITIGTGGASVSFDSPGLAGNPTTALGITALGGGGGKCAGFTGNSDGASGGGGTYLNYVGGFGTPGQGNNGGTLNSIQPKGGAGGGGAFSPGENAGFDNSDGDGGDGGAGVSSAISGTIEYYGAGGGGASAYIDKNTGTSLLLDNNGTFTYSTTLNPNIIPLTIFMYDLDGSNFNFIVDDGLGNLYDANDSVNIFVGTVNYVTGEITATFTTAGGGTEPTGQVEIDYNYYMDIGAADPIGGVGGSGVGGNGYDNLTVSGPTAGINGSGGGGTGFLAFNSGAGGDGVFYLRYKFRN